MGPEKSSERALRNMMNRIKVTVLGSGTCVPSLKRSACAVFIEIDNQKILLDLGPGTMHRLLERGIRVHEITHILLSHFHPDHTGELATFLFANKYPYGDLRKVPLTIIGATGLTSFYERLKGVYGEWIAFKPEVMTVLEVTNTAQDSRSFKNTGLTISTIPVEHRPESVAYRISGASGKSVVYSGDTDYSDNLIALAQDADLFICESAMPDGMKVAGHLTPSLAGKIATQANVKKLMLTHFYPECDQVDMMFQGRKNFSGQLILAEDLMTVVL